MKLMIHELRAAIAHLQRRPARQCQKILARCKQVLRQLTEQWSVLETLTPSEYMEFRDVLGPVVGLPVAAVPHHRIPARQQERGDAARCSPTTPRRQAALRAVLEAPSLYDEFLRYLARHGHAVPRRTCERDWSQPHVSRPGAAAGVRAHLRGHRRALGANTHLCEDLVDLETQFQLWRFRHMRTVMRIIGFKRGTGGSSGVGFLQQALELTFFPELFEVRTADRRASRRTDACAGADRRAESLPAFGRGLRSAFALRNARGLTRPRASVILARPARPARHVIPEQTHRGNRMSGAADSPRRAPIPEFKQMHGPSASAVDAVHDRVLGALRVLRHPLGAGALHRRAVPRRQRAPARSRPTGPTAPTSRWSTPARSSAATSPTRSSATSDRSCSAR